jgi:transcriptional regulator with XRE-family HTH domain
MRGKIEPFYQALGSTIHRIRRDCGLTQAQLARSLTPPSTRASIANIENGKQRVLAHTLAQLATALSKDVQDLMPPLDQPRRALNPADFERELRKKLKLSAPALKRLSAHLATGKSGSVA